MQQQTLELREKVLGLEHPEHPETLTSVWSLASLLYKAPSPQLPNPKGSAKKFLLVWRHSLRVEFSLFQCNLPM